MRQGVLRLSWREDLLSLAALSSSCACGLGGGRHSQEAACSMRHSAHQKRFDQRPPPPDTLNPNALFKANRSNYGFHRSTILAGVNTDLLNTLVRMTQISLFVCLFVHASVRHNFHLESFYYWLLSFIRLLRCGTICGLETSLLIRCGHNPSHYTTKKKKIV